MKLYMTEVLVGNYTITAIGETPEKTIKALVKAYHNFCGSFTENGFKNQADWLEWHGVSLENCQQIALNSAIVH